MNETRVVNGMVERGDVYIGRRRGGMHFGNPYTHLHGTLGSVVVATRAEAVAAYDAWLDGTRDRDLEPERRAWILECMPGLRGLVLQCHCKPAECHGDVLVRRAEEAWRKEG